MQNYEKRKLFCKRAGIETRNRTFEERASTWTQFLQGITGDAGNIMLTAAVFNFKRALRLLLRLIKKINGTLTERYFLPKNMLVKGQLNNINI